MSVLFVVTEIHAEELCRVDTLLFVCLLDWGLDPHRVYLRLDPVNHAFISVTSLRNHEGWFLPLLQAS